MRQTPAGRVSIRALYPNFFYDKLIAHVALRLLCFFNTPRVQATLMGISSDHTMDPYRCSTPFREENQAHGSAGARQVYHDAFPRWQWLLLKNILGDEKLKLLAEKRFFRTLKKHHVAYLFPQVSLSLFQRIKDLGCPIVLERINTLRLNSKAILDAEYQRLRLPPTHGLDEQSAKEELEKIGLADFIYGASPAIIESLLRAGVPERKIIPASYGLDPDDILEPGEDNCSDGPITVLFVGRICVRKGGHLLLDAWEDAAINGKLLLVGSVDPVLADRIDNALRDPSIEHIPFVNDLRPIYRQADIFILPSLEEGSPLVTYLAFGAGLPMVVSPMGAGGVVEDGRHGIIVDPHDRAEIVAALRKLSLDPALRRKMASASAATAPEFLWDKVAARRRQGLLTRLRAVGVDG